QRYLRSVHQQQLRPGSEGRIEARAHICSKRAHVPRFDPQNLAAIAADVPIEDSVVAACIMVFHFWFCPSAFSGTTTISPGRNAVPSGFPLNHPLDDWPPTIDPSARMTKIAGLSASWLGPPACAKYQFAFRPGR